MLDSAFFDQPADHLAIALLGKVIRHRLQLPGQPACLLSARIIETEAYELTDKASHSSLGYTETRRAVFMAPGTIYMYYARGGDSLNFSAQGYGDAVLVKSGYAWIDQHSPANALATMHQLNPANRGERKRERLCSGQTLLCRSLGLRVPDWNAKQLQQGQFWLEDTSFPPDQVVQCRRLGIPEGRDENLRKRYVDAGYASSVTANPLTRRQWRAGIDYHLHDLRKGVPDPAAFQ